MLVYTLFSSLAFAQNLESFDLGDEPNELKAYNQVKEDPFLKVERAPTHLIQVQLIEHGAKLKPTQLERQISTAENVYSQCPGVNLKIEIINQVKLPKTYLQESLVDFDHGSIILNDNFFEFYGRSFEHRKAGVIDVHMVRFLDKVAREEFRRERQISVRRLGKSWANSTIHWTYRDERLHKSPSPKELAGDSLLLATTTLNFVENTRRGRIPDPDNRTETLYRYQERHSTLLTHELGHFLLEPQTPETHEFYTDHFCPGLNEVCPKSNVMSPGGYTDYVFYDRFNRRKTGYSPLPNIEEAQCEVFLNHPKVIRL